MTKHGNLTRVRGCCGNTVKVWRESWIMDCFSNAAGSCALERTNRGFSFSTSLARGARLSVSPDPFTLSITSWENCFFFQTNDIILHPVMVVLAVINTQVEQLHIYYYNLRHSTCTVQAKVCAPHPSHLWFFSKLLARSLKHAEAKPAP